MISLAQKNNFNQNISLEKHHITDVLRSLVHALELKDVETYAHSRRVSLYSRCLAQRIGLIGDELENIERGALLHDIGKIGISDKVLLKPGKLSKEEWQEMRRHPMLGYKILRKAEFLTEACLIVLQHQERWDGAGYPAGLKGREICLGARIFHVVDAYDAITSDRPYRSAQSYEAARSEIQRFSNKQFDPSIVEIWCSVEQEVWDELRMAV